MEKAITTVTLRKQSVSPKKARLVMDLIRMKNAQNALDILENTNKKTSKLALSLLKSAIDAAKNKDFKAEDLIICESVVQEGRRMKRFFIRARGRSAKYEKRSSHLKLSLGKTVDFKKVAKDSKSKSNDKESKKTEVKQNG